MVIIDKEKCIGCGKCVLDCVAENLEVVDGKARLKDDCFQCGHCVAICASGAVSIPEYDMDDVDLINANNKITPEVFLNCIKARRSIRDFTDEKISDEKIELMAQAGRYTATARNGQFHKYIFVQKDLPKLKEMVWSYIEEMKPDDKADNPLFDDLKGFAKRRREDASYDFLFRNAPAVLFVASEQHLDAGMAAQNIEMMATTMGIGALFNGYLNRAANDNKELKKWFGIENETICATMLLGYPTQEYSRTAPRKKANYTIL